MALDAVDEIAVHDFVNAADAGAPAFEDVLLAGVVFGVWVEIEVALVLDSDLSGVGSEDGPGDFFGGHFS